ncbi:MAP3K12-binding inhibitory protein 1 [Trichoplax sp. H2]|nr:MAP3K12-binding inhibitory protein 1 [Trichoplax sp. H2]|eukprot:RDD44324.1 MAP3K12-binding inhibitory protein 1 [Trichoplax sp. H2]
MSFIWFKLMDENMAEIELLRQDCKKIISQQLDRWTANQFSDTSTCPDTSASTSCSPQTEKRNLAKEIKNLILSLQEVHQKLTDNHNQDQGESSIKKSASKTPKLDPSIVQIIANKSEIGRRINAFIERKKLDANITNKREFYPISDNSNVLIEEGKSARTHAMFVKRNQQSSHVKEFTSTIPSNIPSNHVTMQVTRVSYDDTDTMRKRKSTDPHRDQCSKENNADSRAENPTHPITRFNLPVGIEERLMNMENYLGIKPDYPVPGDIYKRLKHLEDRILFLESVSPEYLAEDNFLTVNKVKKQEESNISTNLYDAGISNLSADLVIDHTTLVNIEENISSLKKFLTKS